MRMDYPKILGVGRWLRFGDLVPVEVNGSPLIGRVVGCSRDCDSDQVDYLDIQVDEPDASIVIEAVQAEFHYKEGDRIEQRATGYWIGSLAHVRQRADRIADEVLRRIPEVLRRRAANDARFARMLAGDRG